MSKDFVKRPTRYISHALVELRKYKKLPIFVQSALLLDLSSTGFKIELTSEHVYKKGQKLWMHIPLPPLGIMSPPRLLLKTECMWFDSDKYRMGGRFVSLKENERHIIEGVIEALESKA